MQRISKPMQDALAGAYRELGRWYHDGGTGTGKALYARGLVTYDGILTEAGMAIRASLIGL